MDATARTLAREEYYSCQDRITQYDQILVAVKSLGTTAAGALLVIGFSGSSSDGLTFMMAGFAALVFWYIEAQWKSFQTIVMQHSTKLEQLLLTDGEYPGPSICQAFEAGFRFPAETIRFIHVATYINVWLPHLPMAMAAFGLFIYKNHFFHALILPHGS